MYYLNVEGFESSLNKQREKFKTFEEAKDAFESEVGRKEDGNDDFKFVTAIYVSHDDDNDSEEVDLIKEFKIEPSALKSKYGADWEEAVFAMKKEDLVDYEW